MIQLIETKCIYLCATNTFLIQFLFALCNMSVCIRCDNERREISITSWLNVTLRRAVAGGYPFRRLELVLGEPPTHPSDFKTAVKNYNILCSNFSFWPCLMCSLIVSVWWILWSGVIAMPRLPSRNVLSRRHGSSRNLGPAARRFLRFGRAAHVALLIFNAGTRKVVHQLLQVPHQFTAKWRRPSIIQQLSKIDLSIRSEWQTRGDYIAFPGGPCVASLVYTVRLIKPGALRYTYQYPDDDAIFEFQV